MSTSGCRRIMSEGDASRYNVLYMHDGQNLFEPQKSYTGVDWGLDQTMADALSEEGNSTDHCGRYLEHAAKIA
jgi:predicted alpha/beta superfamily hydrolase